MKTVPFVILLADAAHFLQICDMLVDEGRRGVDGNFLCNLRSIAGCYGCGELWVCVDGDDERVVGYLAGDLLAGAILQVRFEHRGKGIGRALVEHLIARHRRLDETLLNVECAPSTSIGFWRKMGFTVAENCFGAIIGSRSLRVERDLPEDAREVAVTIRFFMEDPRGPTLQIPLGSFSPASRVDARGHIHLGERVQMQNPTTDFDHDVYVDLSVNGERLYIGKVKYPQASAIGFGRIANGWAIDSICPRKAEPS